MFFAIVTERGGGGSGASCVIGAQLFCWFFF